MKLSVTEFIRNGLPAAFSKLPQFLQNTIILFLQRILKENKISALYSGLSHLKGHSFNEQLLDELNVSFTLSGKSLQNIPSEGRVLIASNHPLGGLDGLLLLRAISLVRTDVKVLANDILLSVENLKELFIPANVFSGKGIRTGIEAVQQALLNEEAVIIFPAGEVSRLQANGIKDNKWKKGLVYFASNTKTPILPVFISGRNSIFFYLLSIIWQPLSYLRLVSEIFNKQGKIFHITCGEVIPGKSIAASPLTPKALAQRLRKHCYLTGKKKPGIFISEKTVASPESRVLLRKELFNSVRLFEHKQKYVFKVSFSDSPICMRELARLREITFRKAGEGTGKNRDFDRYDSFYHHLVLWDDENLEIAGSYRIGNGSAFTSAALENPFYTASLFQFSERLKAILPYSLELGRSFIQEKYWRSNALDLLWSGIAAYINLYPQIQYLFGPVSVSGMYPDDIKHLIIYYYEKWYKPTEPYGTPYLPLAASQIVKSRLAQLFEGDNPAEDLKTLKKHLKIAGYTIPVLFRQYTELCEPGGVSYSGFNLDPMFNHCIDGLMVLDLNFLKQEKKERYFGGKSAPNTIVA